MKRLVLLVFFLVAVYMLKAQDSSFVKWHVKSSTKALFSTSPNRIYMDGLQFYVQKQNVRMRSEFGLQDIDFSKVEDYFHFGTMLSYRVLYDYVSKENYQLFASGGLLPYVQRSSFTPLISSSFKRSSTQMGVLLQSGLGGRIKLGDKMFTESSVTLNLGRALQLWDRVFDPALPKLQQRYASFQADFRPHQLGIECGVGFTLS